MFLLDSRIVHKNEIEEGQKKHEVEQEWLAMSSLGSEGAHIEASAEEPNHFTDT